MKKLLTTAALAAAITTMAPAENAQAMGAGMEKCYGVAKAGKNDCGANGHSCAGMAKTDADAHEWIAVPEGTCSKIVGASTTDMDKDAH